MNYYRVDHGPVSWVKAPSPQDAAASMVEAGMDNEDDQSEWSIEEVPAAERMTLNDDGVIRKGTMAELFGDDPPGVLASTEY